MPGLRLLDESIEDAQAGIRRCVVPGGAVVKLTTRQVEIIGMPPQQKQCVPQMEMARLGKLIMDASQTDVDDDLKEMEERHCHDVPDFIPEPYTYMPLTTTSSIRLIRMLPDTEDGMIQIALDEYDLEQEMPVYFCLSYCWSNPHAISNAFDYSAQLAEDYDEDTLFPIACNGRLLYVLPNLYDALRSLPDAPGLQVRYPTTFNGETVHFNDLHNAAVDGNLSLVKINIWRGAMLDSRDTQGRTSLMLATIKGHKHIVRTLLEAGADTSLKDFSSRTCLDHALECNRHTIMDVLLCFDTTKLKRPQRKNKHLGIGTRLWVDAICINQNSISEKNQQVNRMDDIYSHSHAKCTILWLGKDDGNGKAALDAVTKLYPAAAKKRLHESDIVPYQPAGPHLYVKAGIPYISPKEWHALATLYLRQNFRRLWCLQEAVLSRHVVMYLGQYEIPWHEFMVVTEQLHLFQRNWTIPPSSTLRASYNYPIEAEAYFISEMRLRKLIDESSAVKCEEASGTATSQRNSWKSRQIPLLNMVLSAVTFECSDPIDHIYGLIGMCKHHPESPQITIDYSKPYEEVYTEMMRLMLTGPHTPSTEPLQTIACIRDSALRAGEGLPSWVLHFAKPGISSFWHKNFDAAGSTKFVAGKSFTGLENELVLEGKKVDLISSLATKRPAQERVTLYDFDLAWPSLLLELPQIYPATQEYRTEVLWRVLCANMPANHDLKQSDDDCGRSSSDRHGQEKVVAPQKYESQFCQQLCAMILSYAEQSAGKTHIFEDEIPVNDCGIDKKTDLPWPLNSDYFSSPHVQSALSILDCLHQIDAKELGGPGCSTPSITELCTFLLAPPFRVWRKDSFSASDPSYRDLPLKKALDKDTQHLDKLPTGEDGFRVQFTRYVGGRRLFVTKDQNYLGLGPMSMQEGDEVWIVKGSRVPFLLRRMDVDNIEDNEENVIHETLTSAPDDEAKVAHQQSKGYYKYIGDLYVHGIMHGEALGGEPIWEEIILL